MPHLADNLLLAMTSNNGLFSARSLGIALWIGLAILTVSLLVLMRTRWGQAKPISKCVALSILGHVLLGGYAYGTRLIFEVPSQAAGQVVQIKMVAETADAPDPPAKSKEARKEWENVATIPMEFQTPPEIERAATNDSTDKKLVERKTVQVPSHVSADQLRTLPHEFSASVSRQPKSRSRDVDYQSPVKAFAAESSPKHDSESAVAPELQVKEIDRAKLVPSNETEFKRPPVETTDSASESAIAALLQRERIESARMMDALDEEKFEAIERRIDNNAELQSVQPNKYGHSGQATFRSASAQRRLADGEPLPQVYSLRTIEGRLEAAQQRGGNRQTEQAVAAALAWLARNQEADGSWNPRKTGGGIEQHVFGHDRQGAGSNADTGITGLAILSFLAAGHTHLEGPYRNNVQRGLEYLLGAQRADGDMAGDAKLFARMYCHSMAMLAISEALALTGDDRIKRYVQKAVDYSVAAQNKNGGGWRYRPGDSGDMSQIGWQIMALKSANLGGIDVPQSTYDGMSRFLETVSLGKHGGLASYRRNSKPSRTMTAEALACRYFLDQRISTAKTREATSLIVSRLPGREEINYYYWYYATLAMYHAGGAEWDAWNKKLQTYLINSQRRDAEFEGSWDPNGVWSGYGGRVYSTAMATLCLEVYYRYLPIVRN